MARRGSGYSGSPEVLTSSENEDILESHEKKPFYKLSFINHSECTVVINDSTPIFLNEGDGVNVNEIDAPIYSLVIVEGGVDYNWMGAF